IVGERGRCPRALLDDELEARGHELAYGFGDERDPALALRRLARDPDPHPANSLRTLTHFFTSHGLPLLFAVVMLESFGVPLPGSRRWRGGGSCSGMRSAGSAGPRRSGSSRTTRGTRPPTRSSVTGSTQPASSPSWSWSASSSRTPVRSGWRNGCRPAARARL